MSEENRVIPVSDAAVEQVSGGEYWQEHAKGTYVRLVIGIAYTVASGDTMTGIAQRFCVTVDEICRNNNIQDPNSIKAGDVLRFNPVVYR